MNYENSLSKKIYYNLNTNHIINWDIVSKNPNAIELIKERIIYQNLPENKDRLRDTIESQINWEVLFINPNEIIKYIQIIHLNILKYTLLNRRMV
jgi:hypothetical protein